jgi:hypothetical protein
LLSLWNEKDFLFFRWKFIDNLWKDVFFRIINFIGDFPEEQIRKLIKWLSK